MKNEHWTAAGIRALKGRERIVSLTAYDATMARLVDEGGAHLILVGDSLAQSVLGYANTLPVTMEQMLHHTAAVARGARRALVVADMPFLSYQVSDEQALRNAGRFLQEAGAGAVKIEGGAFRAATIRRLVANGIPVLGHIGLTPQSLLTLGGYRVQGRGEAAAQSLIEDARAVAAAGAFAVVVECVPPAIGAALTEACAAPTIGIGAGPQCDGQILVINDLVGLTPAENMPRLAKRYAETGDAMREAVAAFRRDVQSGAFPGPDNLYS